MRVSRRTALKAGLSSLAYFTAEATAPNWLIQSAEAVSNTCLGSNDHVLVIIHYSFFIFYR